MILSPTLAAAARLPMRTLDSVSRPTGPPAFNGPAMAAGAITPALSAAAAPAQTSARRRLVFNTTYPSLGPIQLMGTGGLPPPGPPASARPRRHHGPLIYYVT